MRQVVWILWVLSFVASCKYKSAHLPPQKMEAVLEDLHLAEAYSIVVQQDSTHQGEERHADSLAAYYQLVLRHHNITLKELEESLVWYKQNAQELDSIYGRMINDLTEKEIPYKTQQP